MSTQASTDHNGSASMISRGNSINDRIDSSFSGDPAHRGSLTPPELDSIHQTNSFKQAMQLEKEDNHELAAKNKQQQQAKESTKS
jgi:hypothetical protein